MNWEITKTGAVCKISAVLPMASPSQLLEAVIKDDPMWSSRINGKPRLRVISNAEIWRKYPNPSLSYPTFRGDPLEP